MAAATYSQDMVARGIAHTALRTELQDERTLIARGRRFS